MPNTWVAINADRQLAITLAKSAVNHVKLCLAAAGSSSVCDAAVQALLADMAGSGPVLACCRALVKIVVNIAAEVTPVTSDALQRALIVRPEIYRHLISDALMWTKSLDRIRPLCRFLFRDEKFTPLWTDLHSRLVHCARTRSELSLEVLRFLCDVHNTLRAAVYPSVHSAFAGAFHDEATIELVDAMFDLDVGAFGVGACSELCSQLLGIALNRLCSDDAVVPSCRVILHLVSADVMLADVRVLAVLSWVLRFHSGLQTERELRFVLETISVCVQAFEQAAVGIDFRIAVTSLLPPLLDLLSSNSEQSGLLLKASSLVNYLHLCIHRSTEALPFHHPSPSNTFTDAWGLETVSLILHTFHTLVSAWPDLERFIRECSAKTCRSDFDVRTSRYILDTTLIGANAKALSPAATWLSELTKTYAVEFLPLFSTLLFRLRKDSDCNVRIELLYLLPHFARCPTGFTRTLRIVLPLSQHQRLRALSIRLLLHLWLVEPRSLSRLQQILLETRSQTNSSSITRAVAASILAVCRQSPTEALCLIPLLQTLLYDKDTLTVALSIEALRECCLQGELDLRIAYRLLEERGIRQYCVGRHPAAFQQLIRLIECDDVDEDDADGLSSTMISWLWQQTSQSTSYFAEIRSSAYETLKVLADRSVGRSAANFVVTYFSHPEIIREMVLRLQDEKSGRVRIALERLVSAVCALQLQVHSTVSKQESAPDNLKEFAVTFPSIVQDATNTATTQWRENQRPSVRDVFAISALVSSSADSSLSDLVASVTSPFPSSEMNIFLCLALPAAWSHFMGKFVSEILRQKRDAGLSGNLLYLAVIEDAEAELHSLDLGDSRIRGNVTFAKAGLALKASAWGYSDIASRLHLDILSVASDANNALMQTTRPAALLAFGATVAALHPTHAESRSSAFRFLFETLRNASDERIGATACLSIALASTIFVNDENDAFEAVHLLEESFANIYPRLKSSNSNDFTALAAGVALWLMWPILVRVLAPDDLVAVHDKMLQDSRFGLSGNASMYCLGGLSFLLFSMGVIDASKLNQVTAVYVDELKKPVPQFGALIAAPMLMIRLRFASNFVGIPKTAPQQFGSRLAELISRTTAFAIIGFITLLGIDILMPFQGTRLPTNLCADSEFIVNVAEVYCRSLTLLSTSAYCSHEVALAAALSLVFLGTSTSVTTLAKASNRVPAPGTLLRIFCDYINRRSAPSNAVLASVIRSVLHIRRYAPSAHLPISSLTSLLSAAADDPSISSLTLRTAIVNLMLWQASHDNILKRSVAALLLAVNDQPVCIQRVLLTGFNDVVNSVNPDAIISLLNSTSLPNVDFLLIGLRRILEKDLDQTVRQCAIQLLGSARIRRLITDVSRYAACFTVLEHDLIESLLPVDDEIAILTRLELVRKNTLRPNALIAIRAFIVGPQDIRPHLVESFAQVCAQSFPMAHRLTWILDMFDLMAAARDPLQALKAVVIVVFSWAHAVLSGTNQTLAGSLPMTLENYDDMSVDSVVRRLLRIVLPSKDDIQWNDDIRRSLVPSLVSLAVFFPRCSAVIVSDLLSVI